MNKIKRIISEQACVKIKEVKLEAKLSDDLGIDSLDIIEIVMTIEEEFDIEIPDEEAFEFKTVEDIVRYVETKKQ